MFVNVHENYLQLLREYYGGDPCVLDKTVKSYDEQMKRKPFLDLSVKLSLEKSESGRVGIEGNRSVVSEKASRDGYSVVSRSSSRLASVSAIGAKKELLEAEIEAEKTAVSLKIYEDDLHERKADIDEDLLLSSLKVPS